MEGKYFNHLEVCVSRKGPKRNVFFFLEETHFWQPIICSEYEQMLNFTAYILIASSAAKKSKIYFKIMYNFLEVKMFYKFFFFYISQNLGSNDRLFFSFGPLISSVYFLCVAQLKSIYNI